MSPKEKEWKAEYLEFGRNILNSIIRKSRDFGQ